ncbi:MAG: biopolymer transporter ExbD [Pseudomonadales bacterium]|nr:biopolymer transporter ExbD [Pseudomonadales bacterium]
MTTSFRQKRRQRSKLKPKPLNLVSLMDIFTILVFFLMLNSSDVEMLEAIDHIDLPHSNAEQNPADNLIISIYRDEISIEGKNIASVADVLRQSDIVIQALATELDLQANLMRQPDVEFVGAVTIVGEQDLSYALLKRILRTCQEASFTRIALAVNQVAGTIYTDE